MFPSVLWPRCSPCIINCLHMIHASLWWLLSIYSGWLSTGGFAVCGGACAWASEFLFDAQFKVGRHYLFMPLLFLFPRRVKNSWHSILGRSQLTQSMSMLSLLNERHAWAHTLRRRRLSIRPPSWLCYIQDCLISDSDILVSLLTIRLDLCPTSFVRSCLSFRWNIRETSRCGGGIAWIHILMKIRTTFTLQKYTILPNICV